MVDIEGGMPSDVQDAIRLKEYVVDLRGKGYVVEKLEQPPLHVSGCDDVAHRFEWYMMVDDAGQVVGYFHAKKGIEL